MGYVPRSFRNHPLMMKRENRAMPKTLTIIASASFAAIAAMASAAGAQDITVTRQLSIGLAGEAAQAALAQCTQQGYRVSVAVYDRSGLLRAYLRGDGASPHSFDSATRKAFTSATFGSTTATLAKRIHEVPEAAGLANIPGILPLGGGAPIKIGDEVVGGIGVAGAPGGDKDEACSNAGIAKVQDRLK
jgi:uncharacterized protein GlcG (DUF336 family)